MGLRRGSAKYFKRKYLEKTYRILHSWLLDVNLEAKDAEKQDISFEQMASFPAPSNNNSILTSKATSAS